MSPREEALQARLDAEHEAAAQRVVECEAALAGAREALAAVLEPGVQAEAELGKLDALDEIDAKQLARSESLRRVIARRHRPAAEAAARAVRDAERSLDDAQGAAVLARRAASGPTSPRGKAQSDAYWRGKTAATVAGLVHYGPAAGDPAVEAARARLGGAA